MSQDSVVVEEEQLETADQADSAEAGALAADDVEQSAGPLDERQWYVIHTYSGYENKVRTNLEHRVESMGVQDKIFQIVIPTEEEVEIKDGQRRTVQKKVYPGYVMVEMAMEDDAWYVVRNTPGVTGFVGQGNHPTALMPSEVKAI